MNDLIYNFFNNIKDKKIALCGIGTSNFPLIKLFTSYGAKVVACDRRTKEQLEDQAQKATEYGATLSLGDNYLKNLDVDIILRTPGMRYYNEDLMYYRSIGVVVTSEMELFFDLCPCDIIAITGSDGKTTTTTIISEILKEQGYNVHIGGNIGTPLLPNIMNIKSDDKAVVELSSFQLISMRKSPKISVVTNVSPNHLDMHKDMDEYIDAKKNVVAHQNAFCTTVLNLDNEISNSFENICTGNLYKFSIKEHVKRGAYLENGSIYFEKNGETKKVINIDEINIKGMHNVENYMAAICAIWDLVDLSSIVKVARTFGGVEHRAEFVREINGVKYYNDSIASSPTRTISGTLSLYDEKIILIAGGYDKNIPYELLGQKIVEKVKTLIIMGNTAPKIKTATINALGYKESGVEIFEVLNMEQAVNKAYEISKNGDIVSMSPASASFDLYKNFDERGKHFKTLVNNI